MMTGRQGKSGHLFSLIGLAAVACLLVTLIVLFLSPKDQQISTPTISQPALETYPRNKREAQELDKLKALEAQVKEREKYKSLEAQRREYPPLSNTQPYRLPHGASPFGLGIRGGHSTLTVDNGTDTDAAVKLIRGKIQLIRSIYIHHGERLTVPQIPPGKYVLRVAFGEDWNPKDHKFNFRRSFLESEVFEITETTSVRENEEGQRTETQYWDDMSVTLHKVLQGNFRTHEISEEVFDYP